MSDIFLHCEVVVRLFQLNLHIPEMYKTIVQRKIDSDMSHFFVRPIWRSKFLSRGGKHGLLFSVHLHVPMSTRWKVFRFSLHFRRLAHLHYDSHSNFCMEVYVAVEKPEACKIHYCFSR